MEAEKHFLRNDIGSLSEEEIQKAKERLDFEPVDVDQLKAEGEHLAREKKQAVIKTVRESATELLDAWEQNPSYASMLVDGYITAVEDVLAAAGKPDDEEGARMLLAYGIESLGAAKKLPGYEELINKIAGSRETLREFVEALPFDEGNDVKPLADEEIDRALDAISESESKSKASA